ncbi:hypothetical protein A2W14_04750 [Candidatus Gottesmanbacteria bacterium RBG_16_37_8]|uniref:Carbohydrate-binding module family 96 domain-containing protein n=1 Tax=Candidatus Gottesmanbacteria bacterium RBG_16_37_8 TaxID=1798371 RepID=A0A1F5YUP8_9BACT|nr:MAG: hypothetical protein A2W14_04750 [Candidatus Gottesmanbacteria bacterium RBG_16_37_8]
MKSKYLLLVLGSLIVVFSVLFYVNSYLQRSKATEVVSCITYVPADYNQDGVIDSIDYLIWLRQNQGTVVCPSPTPSPIVLNVKEDSYVNSNYPNNNSGTESDLKIKASPNKITYIKFDLSALSGLYVNSAKLRFWITDPSNGIMNVQSVSDNSWTEKGITYNNRPPAGTLLTSFNPTSSRTYHEIDITQYTRKNLMSLGKMMSLAIQTSSTNELQFKSRNVSDPAKRPVLIVQISKPSPTPTAALGWNTPPIITSSQIEGLLDAPPGSPYPYIASLDEPLDPLIEGYDYSDDVSAAVDLTLPDGSMENAYVNVALPEYPAEICAKARCFSIWTNNFTTSQPGYHKITIRVADSKGAQALPKVYEFMVVSDPPTTPLPTPPPGICTTDNECLNNQYCKLGISQCVNLVCPVPLQCKTYSIVNHKCVLGNSPDGMVCTSSGLQGTCQSGICVM